MSASFDFLRLEEAQGIEKLDNVSVSSLHAKIIQKKPFLKRLYRDFYEELKRAIPGDLQGKTIVELGSGGGFIKEVIPQAITSDVMPLPHVDKHFSVFDMPFEDNSVDTFLMLDVFHHVQNARLFLKELDRCLKNHGRIIMIEPANTFWSRIIFKNFHHEPFDPQAGWSFDGDDPLFSANGALPWIVFERDKERLRMEFPSLKVSSLKPHSPLRYLFSGGVSIKQLVPSCFYPVVRGIEIALSPFDRYLGMFMTIEVEKIN
jgi:SAM-dependent methyltransferase